ncbi:sugar MFS transporter [candidate division KSB1 bacterium]|nr:sugar MFS transporter [candidate division KSB1 bacterium]
MKRNVFIMVMIFIIFSVISFLTNIINPLIPEVKRSFELSNTMAGFLPFAFFIAYGFMSIPSGMMVEKFREKRMMLMPFALASGAAIMFVLMPNFPVYLISLFLIGLGMAMLQVTINPLLRVAGGEEHFAFNSVIAQLFFGGASYLGPLLYSYLVLNLKDYQGGGNLIVHTLAQIVPSHLPWVSLYWIFAVVTLIMVGVIAIMKFPKVELKADEKAGGWETHKLLFKNKMVWLYFFAIFCYVGSEQGIGNWISEFLYRIHGYDPQTVGANAVAWFWGLLTIGCLLGLLVIKLFDSRKVIIGSASAAILCLTVALLGSGSVAKVAFPLVGFFYSVMWSIIFSLALNSVKEHHGSFSGILCTGIIGGAIVPLIIGALADAIGLRFGMFFLYVTIAYILSIGFWAKPLITNKTIRLKKEKSVSA